ncbi:hypothetical protein [Metapseudomonas boanensis]|uniref:Uncharacterized protein n=1 Tax=Metapseudomonas boanensis TaxID=2822138 RepID=A0ABS5XFY4_9GAMM|nr:hypothetical protein [Pseudomonas boanensis]MBT8766602.1 hypothetical protein [Pseudomonas boanensis]
MRPSTRAKLEELMAWHGITEISEAVQLLIMNTHALGSAGSASALAVPRHNFTTREYVALELYAEGTRIAGKRDREDA